jgi:hypothetical protein
MTEGTRSYLIGCHGFFFHPLWVIVAWRKVYGSYPKFWQIVCIFLLSFGLGTAPIYLASTWQGDWFFLSDYRLRREMPIIG